MSKIEKRSLKAKLLAAVKNVLKSNKADVTQKIEKFVRKSVKQIVKKTDEQLKKQKKENLSEHKKKDAELDKVGEYLSRL